MLDNLLNKLSIDKKKSQLERQGFKPVELPLENGINFSAEDKQGELQALLKRDGQELFDFKSLTPAETIFVYNPDNKWSVDITEPKQLKLNL